MRRRHPGWRRSTPESPSCSRAIIRNLKQDPGTVRVQQHKTKLGEEEAPGGGASGSGESEVNFTDASVDHLFAGSLTVFVGT